MPFKDKEQRRTYQRNYMRRRHGFAPRGGEKGIVKGEFSPSPEREEFSPLKTFPWPDLRLKAVRTLLDYLGIDMDALTVLPSGTKVVYLVPDGHNQVVLNPRTGELLGMIPENNARGLDAIWQHIYHHETELALLKAQMEAEAETLPYTGIYTWTDNPPAEGSD